MAARVAQELNGMMLAEAYVVVKGAGFQLSVDKIDGVPRQPALSEALETVHVDVVDGFVRKSWPS